MKDLLSLAIDPRQTPQWAMYLKSIGWVMEHIGKTQVAIRIIPGLGFSTIKIQHPVGPLPLGKIDTLAKKHRALFVVIEPHITGYDEADFAVHGYQKSKMLFLNSATLLIDLAQPEKELFASFSENARRNIKKAQKNTITIKVVETKNGIPKEWFDHFYRLLKNLTSMKHFYVPSYEEYYKKMTAFKDTSYLVFAMEKGNKEPIGVVWFAAFDKTVSYFQTGIANRGYELLVNYLLVWEGLKIAQKKKLKVFDFESIYDPRYPRTNKRWKGYSGFKTRFHGTVVTYPPSWIKIYNPFFKAMYAMGTYFSRL